MGIQYPCGGPDCSHVEAVAVSSCDEFAEATVLLYVSRMRSGGTNKVGVIFSSWPPLFRLRNGLRLSCYVFVCL